MSNITKDVIAEAINDPNFSFIESFADASEPAKIKKEMTRLLFFNRQQREQLKEREREKVRLQNVYDKKKREAYIKHSTAPNEKTRAVLVEIDTEKEKFALEVVDQHIKEINRNMTSVKLELDTWKSITYNIRTEMGSF